MATVSSTATTDSRPRRRIATASQRTIARAGIATGALLAAAIFVPASLADWASVDHPRIAARIAPWNAPAAAAAAAALGADPRNPEVKALVRKALARDLTLVPAIEVRALDLALSGRTDDARRLFQLSDRLSRRSLPTRLWLIQDSVDHGDVAGALKNFDIALRTTSDAQPILFPVLARAAADPTLTVALARMLDRTSDWRLMFINWTLTNGAHLEGVASVVAQMRDRRFIIGNAIDQQLMQKLVDDHQYVPAIALNAKFGRPVHGIADRHFADPSAHYPFGWGLVSDGSLTAERTAGGAGPVLSYRAEPAHSGQIAAQLLTLQPGRYALAAKTAADASGEAPYWTVNCGDAGGTELVQLDQPLRGGTQAVAEFAVPPGCAAQWLTLRLRPSASATPQTGAIAWISVGPR